MKKFVSVMLSLVFSALLLCLLVGCAYRAPSNRCIVALPQSCELYDANGKQCKYIDKEIKGVEKNWNMLYYSVVKNAEYTLTSNYFLFPYTGSNPGQGINGEHWVPAYWQGSIKRSLTKTYAENSDLQDEVIYTTNFKDTSVSIKVSFSENCTVISDYQEYLYVGGILEVVEKGSAPVGNADSYLNVDGSVKERTGIYYLLLKDEVCVHQDAWKTNLEVINYSYHSIKNYGVAIQADFTAKPLVVSDNEETFLHIICRTSDGQYFVYSTTPADAQGFTMPVREHELKLTFEN